MNNGLETISNRYATFSGSDTLAFMLFPGAKPILMGQISTVSYSTFRDKKPVNLINRINVAGFTNGNRVCAGTMVFTLINKHWVNDVRTRVEWLNDYLFIKPDELPPFDVMLISGNELGHTCVMKMYGVRLLDDAQVNSVEDLFTENQSGFICADIDTVDKTFDFFSNANKVEEELFGKPPTDNGNNNNGNNNGGGSSGGDNTGGSGNTKPDEPIIPYPPIDDVQNKKNRYIHVYKKGGTLDIYDDSYSPPKITTLKYPESVMIVEDYGNGTYLTKLGYVNSSMFEDKAKTVDGHYLLNEKHDDSIVGTEDYLFVYISSNGYTVDIVDEDFPQIINYKLKYGEAVQLLEKFSSDNRVNYWLTSRGIIEVDSKNTNIKITRYKYLREVKAKIIK